MERRRRKQTSNNNIMYGILGALLVFLTLSLLIHSCTGTESNKSHISLGGDSVTPSYVPDPTDAPDADEPYVVGKASIGVTGDIMSHGPVINSALQEDGTYDFSKSFQYIAPYYAGYDFMIANLELTMGGTAAGEYRGYPTFNCPDDIVDGIKDAGIDLVLTSNNHSYDTGHAGFIRTQEVLNQKGLAYTGTKLSTDSKSYTIQNINGIKVGMINYTYETEGSSGEKKSVNGLIITDEDAPLINTFNYKKMDLFYSEVESAVNAMRSDGADFVMFFIHWGNEYQNSPSNTQKKIAMQLCELGVDVIVGGHPHVVQPMQVLTAESGHKTYCIYSIGNALSNQRRYEIKEAPEGHTEDGIIFGVEFKRWSDGRLEISDIHATPLWVSLDQQGDKSTYTILPVDISYKSLPAISTFANTVNNVIDPKRESNLVEAFPVADPSQIGASYNRTMITVLPGLNECRAALGLSPIQNVAGN